MGMLLLGTVYVFSIILAVFLTGLRWAAPPVLAAAESASANCAGLVPDSAHGRNRLDRLRDRPLAARWNDDVLTTTMPGACTTRFETLRLGDFARDAFLGRELSLGMRGGSEAGRRFGTAGRRNLRGQYAGRNRRRAAGEFGADPLDRLAAYPNACC